MFWYIRLFIVLLRVLHFFVFVEARGLFCTFFIFVLEKKMTVECVCYALFDHCTLLLYSSAFF